MAVLHDQGAPELRLVGLTGAVLLLFVGQLFLADAVSVHEFSSLWLLYLQGSFALWVLLGGMGLLWLLFDQRPRPGRPTVSPATVIRRWLQRRLTGDGGAALFWPPLLFATLMTTFNAFKQRVLPQAGFGLDEAFAQADRLLFLGVDPWRITHGVFSSPAATWAIDRAYHGWFVPMALGVVLCAWLPRSSFRLRARYLLSYVAVWTVLGSVLAYLLPAAGPWHLAVTQGAASDFTPLMAQLMADQAAVQLRLEPESLNALANQAMLLRVHEQHGLAMGGGISAMPSIHNALAVLFALAAGQMNRRFGAVMWGYAALIWIGSIHLGWHYAVDGLVAGLLTCAIWRLCDRLATRLERPLLRRAPPTLLPAE